MAILYSTVTMNKDYDKASHWQQQKTGQQKQGKVRTTKSMITHFYNKRVDKWATTLLNNR